MDVYPGGIETPLHLQRETSAVTDCSKATGENNVPKMPVGEGEGRRGILQEGQKGRRLESTLSAHLRWCVLPSSRIVH